jgi:hypothetical protein
MIIRGVGKERVKERRKNYFPLEGVIV